MKIAKRTDKGLVRKNNEDYLYADPELNLFILCDGMGGHLAGETASKTAVLEISEYFKNLKIENSEDIEKAILEAIEMANSKILRLSSENEEYKGMGTTLSIGLVFEDNLYYTNIGDSRIYEMDNEGLRLLTRDDTYVNYLLDMGEISEEEAKNHPNKNVLTQALGTESKIKKKNVFVSPIKDKIFLMASDGLTNMVTDKKLEEILKNEDLEAAADELLREALDNGGVDNITFIIFTSRC